MIVEHVSGLLEDVEAEIKGMRNNAVNIEFLKKRTEKLNEGTKVSTDLKSILSIVVGVAIGVWAYFGLHETLNTHATKIELMQKDLEQNSEFRIKYPRGELGQSAGEAELFMIVEHVSGLLEDVEAEIKGMRNNAVNIEFLKKRTEKLTEDVEKIIRNGSGKHQ